MRTKTDRNLLILTAFRRRPDWTFAQLGEAFGITGQRASAILKTYEREYGVRFPKKWRHKKKRKARQ